MKQIQLIASGLRLRETYQVASLPARCPFAQPARDRYADGCGRDLLKLSMCVGDRDRPFQVGGEGARLLRGVSGVHLREGGTNRQAGVVAVRQRSETGLDHDAAPVGQIFARSREPMPGHLVNNAGPAPDGHVQCCVEVPADIGPSLMGC